MNMSVMVRYGLFCYGMKVVLVGLDLGFLKDILLNKFPADLVFLNEPYIFQADLKMTIDHIK